MRYRADIDGLRAVAVVSVIAFHVDPAFAPGGFVGVDIFFVISGFLISGIIATEASGRQFSLAEFYRRRIKRIFPAMFVVTIATLIACALLFLPDDVADVSASAIATIFFVANLYFIFFLDAGYFAESSAAEPLLHMWSLGVEEQFYLIWPLALVGLLMMSRRHPRIAIALGAAVAIASLALGEALFRQGAHSVAYYLLFPRIFEFLAGAAVFFVLRSLQSREVSAIVAAAMGAVGAGMIVWSLATLSGEDSFPGLNASAPAIGTALLILAGGLRTNPLSAVLANRAFVWVGLRSFSLYLWHWPVLAIIRYFLVDLSAMMIIVALALIVALSAATYSFVERPARRTQASLSRLVLTYFAAPAAAACIMCGVLIVGHGFLPWERDQYRAELAAIDEVRPPSAEEEICQRAILTVADLNAERCLVSGPSNPLSPRVLLYGDSHAAHFAGFFTALADHWGFSVRNVAHSACPPVENAAAFTSDRYRVSCLRSGQAFTEEYFQQYDVIVLSASWLNYDGRIDGDGVSFRDRFDATLHRHLEAGRRVVLVGRTPHFVTFDRDCGRKAIRAQFLNCERRSAIEIAPYDINEWIRELAQNNPDTHYFDVWALLCADQLCSPYRPDQGNRSTADSYRKW